MTEGRWTLAQALLHGRNRIEAVVPDTPLLDAQLLLMHVLQCDRTTLMTWPERELSAAEATAYWDLVAQRESGCPIAYLTGVREFWSLPLRVDSSTLIPRPDSEILVETALQTLKKKTARVLELGTGTGAIALALQHERPDWKITAVDVIPRVVELAQVNAAALGLVQVEILQSHWFSAIPRAQQFDLIMSNPPYLAADDVHLKRGDLRFEPHSALVAADSGWADLVHIAEQSLGFLRAGGWLMLEHGAEQGAELRDLLRKLGYVHIDTALDYAGLERVTYAQSECSKVPATFEEE